MTRSELLHLYPALTSAPAAIIDALLRPEARVTLPAGTRIFAETEPCRGFPLVVDGSIKVVKTAPNGREMLLYRVEPGDSCIISSSCLLGHTAYTARGETESDVVLLVLPASSFERLMSSCSDFRDFVFHLFAQRIAELMELIEEVAFHRLDQRLAKLLLVRGEGSSARDEIHTTHQALADELGSVREIVSRLLKGFATQGLISLERERISLQDRKGLQALAEHGPA